MDLVHLVRACACELQTFLGRRPSLLDQSEVGPDPGSEPCRPPGCVTKLRQLAELLGLGSDLERALQPTRVPLGSCQVPKCYDFGAFFSTRLGTPGQLLVEQARSIDLARREQAVSVEDQRTHPIQEVEA